MTPYVQREVFRAFEQGVFAEAERLVASIDNHWKNELRCHELARAVHAILSDRLGLRCIRVVDGIVGAVNHSWIEISVPVAETEKLDRVFGAMRALEGATPGDRRLVVLDVYCPGRLPQVQLIDGSRLLRPLYEEGPQRSDINADIVARVIEEMRRVAS